MVWSVFSPFIFLDGRNTSAVLDRCYATVRFFSQVPVVLQDFVETNNLTQLNDKIANGF